MLPVVLNSKLFCSFRKLDWPEYLSHVYETGSGDVGRIDIGFCLKLERSPLKTSHIYDSLTVMFGNSLVILDFVTKPIV